MDINEPYEYKIYERIINLCWDNKPDLRANISQLKTDLLVELVKNGNTEKVITLINNYGTDIESKDRDIENKNKPVYEGHIDIVKILIKKSAGIDSNDSQDSIPLHHVNILFESDIIDNKKKKEITEKTMIIAEILLKAKSNINEKKKLNTNARVVQMLIF
jgi:hypothetical protein